MKYGLFGTKVVLIWQNLVRIRICSHVGGRSPFRLISAKLVRYLPICISLELIPKGLVRTRDTNYPKGTQTYSCKYQI